MEREKHKRQKPRGKRTDAELLGRTNSYERRGLLTQPEQRGWVKRLRSIFNWRQEEVLSATKPFSIAKQLVRGAYAVVKSNDGAAGVDRQTIEEFEKNLERNLYKLWNRMSSGSYFPPAVRAVVIPKKTGGERILGIPTVTDRVAQMVVKMTLEPEVEPIFLPDSYGYRPGKSALDAVGITRERCWKYDWVLEFDVQRMFDEIDHERLMRAVRKHTKQQWVILYVERWLTAPMQLADGTEVERTRGTPQGGVVSPLLANLFMHYVFDAWMQRTYPNIPWCRYADDGLVHCRTEQEAEAMREALSKRLEECGLKLHPEKTKIVYCKDSHRRGEYPTTQFDFLGYTFRPRAAKNCHQNKMFVGFLPAVSSRSMKAMRQNTRKANFRNRTDLSLMEIGRLYNPVLRGWNQYYGRFYPSAMHSVLYHFNQTLVGWAMRKYRALRGHKTRAERFLARIAKKEPKLLVYRIHRNAGLVS